MRRLTQYLVYRKGSNSANQSCAFDWVPIAIVEAASREQAKATTWGDEKPNVHGCPALAAKVIYSCGNLDVWSNQYLQAVPRSKAKKSDWQHVENHDANFSEYEGQFC